MLQSRKEAALKREKSLSHAFSQQVQFHLCLVPSPFRVHASLTLFALFFVESPLGQLDVEK